MGVERLGVNGVKGMFYLRLQEEMEAGLGWVPLVSNYFQSDMLSEEYPWLGMSPAMREWVGGRQAKAFTANGIEIANKEFEATIRFRDADMRRDKTDQIQVRINELVERTNSHWNKLLTELILNGDATKGYDNKYFFAANHTEGKSGALSNTITVGVVDEGNVTTPEFEAAVLAAVEQLYGFKDDQGEPINEAARQFLVLSGPQYFSRASAALKNPVIVDASGARTNTLTNLGGYGFQLEFAGRLSDATKSFYVFRTDCTTHAFIRQEEVAPKIDSLSEGSDEFFKTHTHLFGVWASRNVGYGMWQRAVKVTFSTSS